MTKLSCRYCRTNAHDESLSCADDAIARLAAAVRPAVDAAERLYAEDDRRVSDMSTRAYRAWRDLQETLTPALRALADTRDETRGDER